MKILAYLSGLFLLLIIMSGCTKEDAALDGTGGETYELIDGGLNNNPNGNYPNPEPGMITAGEWNDLEHWEFWNALMLDQDNYMYLEMWQIFPKKRYSVIVTSESGKPICDVVVYLHAENHAIIWKARTNNKGRAELWTGLTDAVEAPGYIQVMHHNEFYKINPIVLFAEGINEIALPAEDSSPDNADIMFIVDATGSMGDEIEYLKTELLDVIDRTANTNAQLNFRLSSVFYRDQGDAYITKAIPFTSQFGEVVDFVNDQYADGGGDYEEAVDAALLKALDQNWSESAKARIAFLMLDAPPHYNTQVRMSIHTAIEQMAEKGIKVIPVTASGINKETEFLMRLLAITTNGSYTFITDDSGIGNDHLEPTIGEFDVEYLNDLLVRIINESCE